MDNIDEVLGTIWDAFIDETKEQSKKDKHYHVPGIIAGGAFLRASIGLSLIVGGFVSVVAGVIKEIINHDEEDEYLN